MLEQSVNNIKLRNFLRSAPQPPTVGLDRPAILGEVSDELALTGLLSQNWLEVDRVLLEATRCLDGKTVTSVFLTKWNNSGYDECTWEREVDLRASPEGNKAIMVRPSSSHSGLHACSLARMLPHAPVLDCSLLHDISLCLLASPSSGL